jgi:hypothetical protein
MISTIFVNIKIINEKKKHFILYLNTIMLTKEILDSHPLKTLKSEISKQNIKGYSNMKRPELTDLMLKNKDKFDHIKMKEKQAKAKAPAKKEKTKKTKGSHAMPKGALMSGKVHSKESKILTPKQIEAELEKRFGKIETKQQLQLLDNLIKKAKSFGKAPTKLIPKKAPAKAKGKKKDDGEDPDPFGTGFGFTISKGSESKKAKN